MTDVAPAPPATLPRPRRDVAIRVVGVLVALVLLVLFAALHSLLTPWVVLGDGGGHGWPRTPSAHRWADSAAAISMTVVGLGALLLAGSRQTRSGLTAWVAACLVVFAASSTAGELIQGRSGFAVAALMGVVTALVLAGPLVALSPQPMGVVRGGERESTGPTGTVRTMLRVVLVLASALVVAAIVWRLTGGVVEDAREDDVVSFVSLGTCCAIGAVIALQGRQGWRHVAVLLAVVAGYVGVASFTLLVAG